MQVGDLVRIRYSNALKMVGKWAIVLETGYENARIYIIDERRTELYANKKLNSPVVITPGHITGIMTCLNASNLVHPSTIALSSKSLGIDRKNECNIHSVKG